MARRPIPGRGINPVSTTPVQEENNVQFIQDYFTYNILFNGLAPNDTQNGTIQIQADSDFKWVKGAFFASIAGAGQTNDDRVIPLVDILITDGGSGRQLMNQPISVVDVFGTGQLPFILPIERIFKARSNITIQVSNFSAAETYDLRLDFIGTKIFQLG
jgi:hypothetical protein